MVLSERNEDTRQVPLPNNFIESNIMIKGIAVNESTVNKSSCNSFGNSKRHTGEYDDGHECDKNSNDKFVKDAV